MNFELAATDANQSRTPQPEPEAMNRETAVPPKVTKEAKEFESFTQTRLLICRVNGTCLGSSFLSAFFAFFGPPTTGLSLNACRLAPFASRLEVSPWITGEFELSIKAHETTQPLIPSANEKL